jgi:phosphonate degradation associated HDIG domain protein
MAISIDYVAHVLTVYGDRQYGREPVSQLEHALQCAQLAEEAGEDSSTVTAALLHDIGHLLQMVRNCPAQRPASDDLHQYIALPFLRGLLPEAVLQPIRLHVDAKRYLCFVEPSYGHVLSPESIRSLKLQGGAFSSDQARKFLAEPFAAEAVRLRRFDDLAKVPSKPTRPLDHFLSLTAALSC